MRKLLVLILISIALMTMAQQCDGGNTPPEPPTNPYQGGTSGLSIQFAEGAPPDEVFDGNTYPFDIELKLLNVGESEVAKEDVKIRISGINPLDFGKTESDFIMTGIQEDLIPTIVDSEGNKIPAPPVFVTFPDLMYEDLLPGNNQFPVRADVCYTYETNAIADGCIRADVLSIDEDAVCQINEKKVVFNSGAPIQVAEFTEQPSGSDKIRYVFKIQHIGSGRVFLPNTRCPSDLASVRTSENRVHFKIESRVQDLVCSGLKGGSGKEGDVYLINGEATLHCTQQTSSSLDYIDKLHITLTYDYKEFVEKYLLVKKTVN